VHGLAGSALARLPSLELINLASPEVSPDSLFQGSGSRRRPPLSLWCLVIVFAMINIGFGAVEMIRWQCQTLQRSQSNRSGHDCAFSLAAPQAGLT
jgi:hypothetical protein